MKELVSIIIPVYNGEKFIEESINSCINQEYENVEIIVVNDGSTDNTLKVLDKYTGNPMVKIISYDNNKGKVYAINKGIKEKLGKYIAIHAADDVCNKNRISEELDLLQKGNFVLVYGDCSIVDESLNVMKESGFANKPNENLFENLLFGNSIPGGTILIDNKVENKIFPIPNDLKFEDWWIALNASINGDIGYLNKPVIKYRQHSNNDCGGGVSGNNKKSQQVIKDFNRHFAYYDYIKILIDKNINDEDRRVFYKEIVEANIIFKSNIIENHIRFTQLFKNVFNFRKVILKHKKFGVKFILSHILGGKIFDIF